MNGDDVTKIPPQSLEAEQATLGSMLFHLDYAKIGLTLLCEEDFYRDANKRIFAAIRRVVASNPPEIDPLYVQLALRDVDELDKVGGFAYLSELLDIVPSGANVEWWAGKVREYALRRAVRDIARDEVSKDGLEPVGLIIERWISRLRALVMTNRTGMCDFPEALMKFLDRYDDDVRYQAENPNGIFGASAGLASLDRFFGGLRPGNLFIASAPSGVGKTAFGVQVAVQNAKAGKRVVFFSMEMPQAQIVERIVANDLRIDLRDIFMRKMGTGEYERMMNLRERGYDIHIDDGRRLTVPQMYTIAERLADEKPLGIVIVDYIQYGMGDVVKDANREQVVNAMAVGLKEMSSKLHCPVLAMSQVNKVGDPRESMGILQAADVEMLIMRNLIPEPGNQTGPQPVSLTIRKNRQSGPTARIDAMWDGRYVQYYDMDERHV